MRRFHAVRTWLWNAGAVLFYIILAGYVLSALAGTFEDRNSKLPRTSKDLLGLCEYTVTHELHSPDNKKMASLGYSDCGATTNWQTGITVSNASTGKTHTGLFGLDGKPEGLKMRWDNDYTLVISDFPIEKMRGFNQDNFSGVRIVLKP